MKEEVITAEERRCLRMWFRQAIVQLEQQEVAAAIYNEHYEDETPKKNTHRYAVTRRRTRRNRTIPHLREMVY